MTHARDDALNKATGNRQQVTGKQTHATNTFYSRFISTPPIVANAGATTAPIAANMRPQDHATFATIQNNNVNIMTVSGG